MGAKQQVGSVYVLQVVLASYDGFSGICNSLAMHLFVQVTKKLILACTLAFLFMLFECVGGYMANRCCSAEHSRTVEMHCVGECYSKFFCVKYASILVAV